VYNASGTSLLATHVSQALVRVGYQGGIVSNSAIQPATQVLYGAGAQANAAKIAQYFGVTAAASTTLAAGHVEVLLGQATTGVPAALSSAPAGPGAGASSPAASNSPSPSPAPTSSADNGAAGGIVTVRPHAKFGIPCVN
jgi:hypothetical protein